MAVYMIFSAAEARKQYQTLGRELQQPDVILGNRTDVFCKRGIFSYPLSLPLALRI